MKDVAFVSLLVFACYTAGALGVVNAFPLSTFSMYSKAAPSSGARVVVKDQAGDYREVVRYVDWDCELGLSFDMVEKTMCPDGAIGQPAGYLSKDALDHIRRHAAPGGTEAGEPVELVIHTVRLGDELVELDCPISRCRARLK